MRVREILKPTRWRKWLYVLLALALVIASSTLHKGLLTLRDAWSWRPAVENFPPSLVLGTQMLGSFRGMLVVGLWLRATTLQEQGRYYELVQLFDWITQLEPRIETVWVYAAWNQSYNISVAFPSDQPEERWRWVMNGIRLLRDRGLVINPRSYLMNRELAWLYFHKVGGTTDEAHAYYKRQMARELHVILGGPAPDYGRLAAAPEMAGTLLAVEPVRSLVEKARAAGFKPLGRDIAWLNDPSKLPEAVVSIFEPARETPAFEALEAFLRARALRDEWHVDPKLAKVLVDKYGPLDFRQPEAHALYWATESLKHVRPTENRIHGERMVYVSLVQITKKGRLYYFPETGGIDLWPDLRFVDAANEEFRRELGRTEATRQIGTEAAYKNWLRDMTAALYAFGQKKKAAEFYAQLAEFDPRPEYEVSLDEFVVAEIEQDLKQGQYEQVANYVRAYTQLYYYWLALREGEVAEAHLGMARLFYGLLKARAPERLHVYLKPTWEEELAHNRDEALDPERGFDEPLRSRLREALGLPPEPEEPPAEETR